MPEKGGRICKRIERFSCQAVTFGSSITPLRVKQSRLEVQAFEKHNSIATLKAVSLQAEAGRSSSTAFVAYRLVGGGPLALIGPSSSQRLR